MAETTAGASFLFKDAAIFLVSLNVSVTPVSPASLSFVGASGSAQQVTHAYVSGDAALLVNLTHTLPSGARFISRALTIARADGGPLRLDSVLLWANLTAIAGGAGGGAGYVATWKPCDLELHTAAFARFPDGSGLFSLLQTPFAALSAASGAVGGGVQLSGGYAPGLRSPGGAVSTEAASLGPYHANPAHAVPGSLTHPAERDAVSA